MTDSPNWHEEQQSSAVHHTIVSEQYPITTTTHGIKKVADSRFIYSSKQLCGGRRTLEGLGRMIRWILESQQIRDISNLTYRKPRELPPLTIVDSNYATDKIDHQSVSVISVLWVALLLDGHVKLKEV
jgi:hypothetical protein